MTSARSRAGTKGRPSPFRCRTCSSELTPTTSRSPSPFAASRYRTCPTCSRSKQPLAKTTRAPPLRVMATRAIRRLRSRMRAAAVALDCSSASLILSLVGDASDRALEALGLRVVFHRVAVERAAAPAVVHFVPPEPVRRGLLREEVVHPIKRLRRLLPRGLRFEAHGVLYHPVLLLAVSEQGRLQPHARERVEERELVRPAVAVKVPQMEDRRPPLAPFGDAGDVVVAPGVDAVGEVELVFAPGILLHDLQSVDDASGRHIDERHARRAAVEAAARLLGAGVNLFRAARVLLRPEHPEDERPLSPAFEFERALLYDVRARGQAVRGASGLRPHSGGDHQQGYEGVERVSHHLQLQASGVYKRRLKPALRVRAKPEAPAGR